MIKVRCPTVGESFADYINTTLGVGTLLTDNLTDGQNVALWVSPTIFAVLLAVVFSVWYARERTLSIHTITTTSRESYYWLTVLVTFALGTAAGDWTLDLTGWGPTAAMRLSSSRQF